MTDRELLQMALDALELLARYENPSTKVQVRKPRDGGPIVTMYPHKVATEAAVPLRARLAQPEPEPFEYWNAVEGWVKIEEVRQHFDTAGCGTIYKTSGEGRVPLYATPQKEWIGLTDEEIGEIADDEGYGYMDVARAIQAKLREKNG